jgi:hypothetical protein
MKTLSDMHKYNSSRRKNIAIGCCSLANVRAVAGNHGSLKLLKNSLVFAQCSLCYQLFSFSFLRLEVESGWPKV